MAGELLAELRALGVELSIDADGRLAYDAPEGAIGDDLLGRMRAERDEVIECLRAEVVGTAVAVAPVARVVHCKREPFDVRIDRSTKWGNPFKVGRDGDRAEVIELYRHWIQTKPDLLAALPELRGKVLGCWCAPLACHGDVLIELLAGFDPDPSLGPEYLPLMPSVICPWCRSGERLLEYSNGLQCDGCDRVAFRFTGESIVRADCTG